MFERIPPDRISPEPIAVAGGTYDSAGQVLVAIARAYGCGAIFGVVSIHNQPLVDAACAAGLFVPMRHEAATVNAADGYARATGGLGIAITSTGTGAGNAAGSLIEALTAGSRVLHVTGQIDAQYVDGGRGVIHETKDQPAMLEAVSKATYAARRGDVVGALLVRAADDVMTRPYGPVSIEIPIDMQYMATTIVPGHTSLSRGIDPSSLTAAAAAIARARRPLLWLGGGATEAGAEIAHLVDKIGAGVLTSNAGRGVLDERLDHVIGNFAAQAAAPLLAEADLLISIGTHFRSNETRHYALEVPAEHIQIDIDPDAIGRVYPVQVGLVGDAAAVVAALHERFAAPATDPSWHQRIAEMRANARLVLEADIGPYAELCTAMRSSFDLASPFVRDVTIPASAWGNRLFPLVDPATNINPRGGGIGQGLAMALGASIARPEVPTLLMVGDGGLVVHLGELGAVAQQQPWLVMLVFNDRGYGVLRNLQDAHFGRRSGVDLTTPDFAILAMAYDIGYRALNGPDEAHTVLTEAVAQRAPVIVEVDCERFGAMPKPFVPPVPVGAGAPR